MKKENVLDVERFKLETLEALSEEVIELHRNFDEFPKLARDIEMVAELIKNEYEDRLFDDGGYEFYQHGGDYNMSDQEIEDAFINQFTDIGGPEDEEESPIIEPAPKPTAMEMVRVMRKRRVEKEAQRIHKVLETGFSEVQLLEADESTDPKEILYRFEGVYEKEPMEIVGYVDSSESLKIFCRVKILEDAEWIEITDTLI